MRIPRLGSGTGTRRTRPSGTGTRRRGRTSVPLRMPGTRRRTGSGTGVRAAGTRTAAARRAAGRAARSIGSTVGAARRARRKPDGSRRRGLGALAAAWRSGGLPATLLTLLLLAGRLLAWPLRMLARAFRRWWDAAGPDAPPAPRVGGTVTPPGGRRDNPRPHAKAPPTPAPGAPPPHPAGRPHARAPHTTPAATETTRTGTGGGMAAEFPPKTVVGDAAAAAGKYFPDSMWEFIEHLGQTPEMVREFGKIFRHLGDKAAAELPAEPAVAGLLHSMIPVCERVAQAAEALKPGAERAHARELEKKAHPHGRLWNV